MRNVLLVFVAVVLGSSSAWAQAAGVPHPDVPVPISADVASGVVANVGPPYAGTGVDTPQSLACVYGIVAPVAGCNPNNKTLKTPAGGSHTVALVTPFHHPNLAADIVAFSKQFGLLVPTAANFRVIPASAVVDDAWGADATQAIEYIHAMAPKAKIVVVEALSTSSGDLYAAIDAAASAVSTAGGGEVVVPLSSPEASDEKAEDSHFVKNKVVFFAPTGNTPHPSYPASSPNVVAVGGTSLSRNPATFNLIGERAWEPAGVGSSVLFARPAFQSHISFPGTRRVIPDIAADADSDTGAWIRFTYYGRTPAWYLSIGTSFAAALVAGITNAEGTFRASSAAELQARYAQLGTAAPKLHDVIYGLCGPYAGYVAAAGWDICTGIGTPKG